MELNNRQAVILNALERLDEIFNETVDNISILDNKDKRAIIDELKEEAKEQEHAGNLDASGFLDAIACQVALDMENE